MAKRIFQNSNWTATPTSDSASTHAASTYQVLAGGSSTQRIDVLEVYWNGLAAASTPHIMQLARVGVIGTSTTTLVGAASDGPEDTATAALAAPPAPYIGGTSNPARSAANSDARLNLGANGFGGIVRWNASPTQQWVILGNAASAGQSILSAKDGSTSGAVSSHIIYEPY